MAAFRSIKQGGELTEAYIDDAAVQRKRGTRGKEIVVGKRQHEQRDRLAEKERWCSFLRLRVVLPFANDEEGTFFGWLLSGKSFQIALEATTRSWGQILHVGDMLNWWALRP